MGNNTNKPLSIIMDETKMSIATAINNSGLHSSILLSIVKDIYMEVNNLAMEQSRKEREEYETSLKENKTEKSHDSE